MTEYAFYIYYFYGEVTTPRATGCILIVYRLCLLFVILSAVNVITFTIILSCCDAVLEFCLTKEVFSLPRLYYNR